MMKILLISSRELCYFSASFFLDCIQRELEKVCEVERVEFSETNLDALQACLDSDDYDAILDINSKLPYLILDDNSRFLDHLHAPFYNYILDHPLYHHPGLVFPLRDYHALAIDRKHKEYMERYYALQSVEYLPLGGTVAGNVTAPLQQKSAIESRKTREERQILLLFTGTYLDPQMVEAELQGRGQVNLLSSKSGDAISDQKYYECSKALIECWNPEVEPMEDALQNLLASHEDAEVTFPEVMNRLYAVDRYKRNETRREVLLAVAKAGIECTVIGEGWEKTELSSYPNVTILPGCPMEEIFDYMANSRMVLDVNPLFFDGLHDRVSAAMVNGAVCLTNMNPDAAPRDRNGETPLLFYQASDLDAMLWKIQEMLAERSSKEWEARSLASVEIASEQCSWNAVAKHFLEIVKDEKRRKEE